MLRTADNVVAITLDRNMFLPGIVAADEAARMLGRDRYDVIVLADKGSVPSEFEVWHEQRGGHFFVSEVDFEATFPNPSLLTRRFPAASIFRLMLADFLGDRWRRILYLDADTEIVRPIHRLFDLDLGGAAVAAADDLTPSKATATACVRSARSQELRRRAGLEPSKNNRYANSGVLLIDVAEWRRQSISERALKFLLDHPVLCKFPDQDAMNAALPETFCVLSPTWNFRADIAAFRPLRSKIVEPAIIHYSGDAKPWLPYLWRGDREATERYLRYFADTPWPNGPPAPDWIDGLEAEHDKLDAGDSRLRRAARRFERAIRTRRRRLSAALRGNAKYAVSPSGRKQRLFELYLRSTCFADISQNLARFANGVDKPEVAASLVTASP